MASPEIITNKNNGHIGRRIKALRLHLGLTQEQLGERADLHFSYVGQIERGDKLPSLKSLQKMARALNTNLETLLVEDQVDLPASSEEVLLCELRSMLKTRSIEDIRLVLEITRLLLYRLDVPRTGSQS